jgi:hypothetical protein
MLIMICPPRVVGIGEGSELRRMFAEPITGGRIHHGCRHAAFDAKTIAAYGALKLRPRKKTITNGGDRH